MISRPRLVRIGRRASDRRTDDEFDPNPSMYLVFGYLVCTISQTPPIRGPMGPIIHGEVLGPGLLCARVGLGGSPPPCALFGSWDFVPANAFCKAQSPRTLGLCRWPQGSDFVLVSMGAHAAEGGNRQRIQVPRMNPDFLQKPLQNGSLG